MKLTKRETAYLLLEDGLLLEGTAIGKKGTKGGEICFNTGMTGYQEIYTDPSYTGQIVVNTTPHIGNYGAIDEEQESDSTKISGIVVNDYADLHSRATADESLQEYLEKNNVVGIADVDTRMLVRHIRSKGAMNAIISSEMDIEQLKKELGQVPSMEGLELSSSVCTQQPYFSGDENAAIKVAVLDLGIKTSILKNLNSRGVYCKVFPSKTSYSEMKSWNPDGYFISNGPGDPAAMDYAVDTLKQILDENKPLFGICLGHQILARACDISTYKMHHGHRGLNHPIKNLTNGQSEITSQNHGFVISENDVENSDMIEATHLHLNDNTVAGIKVKNKNAFAVQYHPESSPGPHDSRYLFDQFIQLIHDNK
ncbi:glutamine-hydrolyzing carbamoyl-phosphate synthase small subunit [Fulvivirga sp. M361]|uniref:glutamine-hydrolyzing carbamoyl-phosphate synthase small subunit n=1 Tax=Fulvivirga sp. M361 TaxID=2594266 RepID=UPI001179AB47|nr:glutamine-hydrolyzing carbamoyl-phosphate synthase small subunit [Fulvivirga sp. M361]TRX53770.1 glutamine-hydrolyzing carbamoyl-phosphate synthase small subunit [Fulvivirga sp. M361]